MHSCHLASLMGMPAPLQGAQLTVFCEGAVTLKAAAGELSCSKPPPCTDPMLLSTLVMMEL